MLRRWKLHSPHCLTRVAFVVLKAGQVATGGPALQEAKLGHLVFMAEFQAQVGILPLFGHKRAQEPASSFIQSICPEPGV